MSRPGQHALTWPAGVLDDVAICGVSFSPSLLECIKHLDWLISPLAIEFMQLCEASVGA